MPATVHDWAAAFARIGGRDNADGDGCPPWSYAMPDGRAFTATSSPGKSRLVVADGVHAPPPVPCQALRPANKFSAETLEKSIRPAGMRHVGWTTAGRIAEAAGPFPAPERVACRECGGDGEVTCPTCDHTHDCKDCEGAGTVSAGSLPPTRFVRIDGLLFDSRLISSFADALPAGPVDVSVKKHGGRDAAGQILFAGAGWRAAVMAYSRHPEVAVVVNLDLSAQSEAAGAAVPSTPAG